MLIKLGARLRAQRMARGLAQKDLAVQLGVSASYLNLLEHDRRPVTTDLLLRLVRVLDVDLRAFGDEDTQLGAALIEVFGDPLFEEQSITASEVGDLVASHPSIARAIHDLHQRYVDARTELETLGGQVLDQQSELGVSDRVRLASEQVSDLIERNLNYFPSLEERAERVWADAQLMGQDLFGQLVRYLEREHRVRVSIRTVEEMDRAVRRFDPASGELHLSEILRRGSRNFQLAQQIGLLSAASTLDDLARDPLLTAPGARELCRVSLAGYFAAAVLMPYRAFLQACERERYDIELLGHRFRVGWEQTCHRLTTLRRPGSEGVSFYMLRVDMAGNISKRFSAAGIRFPRFSGLCSLWNVHAAFAQPGRVRVQLSQLPGGHTVLAIARTVRRDVGSFRFPEVFYSVGVGCDLDQARRLVYADAVNLDNTQSAVPIGITCRLCERADCTARAFPSLREPLRVNENVRGVSFFAPVRP
jgi:predicted transcriptional regulator/DNA-binding Xre family transcriptional regulator